MDHNPTRPSDSDAGSHSSQRARREPSPLIRGATQRQPLIETIPQERELRTFVVPIDFSSPSLQALRWAASLARGTHARLLAVHAIESTPLAETETVECLLQDTAMEQLRAVCGEYLREGLTVDRSCAFGKAAAVIERAVASANDPFVVMGNRGLSAVKRLFVGSVTDRVQRSVSCPVFVVHDRDEPQAQLRVVFATDFHLDADQALSVLVDVLASRTTAPRVRTPANSAVRVELVHVLPIAQLIEGVDVPVVYSADLGVMETEAHERLDLLAADLRRRGIETGVTVVHGDPARGILDCATSTRADLIVLGRRSMSSMARVLLGDTAEQVLHRAHCAVLTVRSPLSTVELPDGRAVIVA